MVRHWILCSGYGGFNVAEATHEMELARRLNPSVPQYLGSLYAHLGLEKQAIQELERALEIDPTSENRTLLLTQGYDLLGRTAEAISDTGDSGTSRVRSWPWLRKAGSMRRSR